MQEQWRFIPGYEGLYQVNVKGEIKSFYNGNKGVSRTTEGHLLKHTKSSTGYYRVDLVKNGEKHSMKIHRAIALAFIPNPENKPYINHKDGNKLNNDISNLEWCTQKENMVHASQTGLLRKAEITRDELYQLYKCERHSLNQIARMKHMGYNRLLSYMEKYHISKNYGRKYNVPIEELKKDLANIVDNKELAKKYKCSVALIATRRFQLKRGLI